MRKKVFGRKLGRERDTRRALFRSLIRSFVSYGKISTTKAKAKAIQPDIEKLVILAKGNAVSNLRQLYSYLGNDSQTAKLFKDISKVFANRKSGFTRITNLARRPGDFAEMARLEWTEKMEVGSKKSEVGKKKGKINKEAEIKEAAPKKKTLKDRLSGIVKKK